MVCQISPVLKRRFQTFPSDTLVSSEKNPRNTMVETHTLQKLRSRKVKEIKGILSGQFGTKNVDMKGLLKAGLIDLVLRKQSERDRGVDTAQSKRKTM